MTEGYKTSVEGGLESSGLGEDTCLPTGWKQCSSVCEPVQAMDDADSLSPQLFENMPILNPMAEQLEEAPVVEMVTDEIGEGIAIPEAATIVESIVVSQTAGQLSQGDLLQEALVGSPCLGPLPLHDHRQHQLCFQGLAHQV